MVGASDCARIAALEAYKVNALALPVEKVAVPRRSFAEGAPSVSFTIAALALCSSKRAAPARIWTLPWGSVLSRSPLKIVVPTSAEDSPTRAWSAVTMVPSVVLGLGPPKTAEVERQVAKKVASEARKPCIESSPGRCSKSILPRALCRQSVNTLIPLQGQKFAMIGGRSRCVGTTPSSLLKCLPLYG